MERRSFSEPVEIRRSDSGSPVIRGYFAKFNTDSRKLGGGAGFIEQIDPRAFEKTLQEADIRGLGNHKEDWVLGRTKAGTMRVGTDEAGGWYEIDVNMSDPDGQRALAKIERGDWDGSSFTFVSKRDEWNWDSKPAQRRLLEVGLLDVGPVTYPAYDSTTVARRALEPMAEKFNRPVEDLIGAMERGEMRSIIDGEQTEERAVWSTAFVNDLPDSSFLYIEPGGSKDSDGKTAPRTLRHFPYKDGSGNVDLPHLRNALARIPQSSLSDAVKAEATAKAQKLLAAANRSDDQAGAEERVGKTISAATADRLKRAMSEIQNLLGYEEPEGEGEPLGDEDDVDAQRAQKLLDRLAEFRTAPGDGPSLDVLEMQIKARDRRIATKRAA